MFRNLRFAIASWPQSNAATSAGRSNPTPARKRLTREPFGRFREKTLGYRDANPRRLDFRFAAEFFRPPTHFVLGSSHMRALVLCLSLSVLTQTSAQTSLAQTPTAGTPTAIATATRPGARPTATRGIATKTTLAAASSAK